MTQIKLICTAVSGFVKKIRDGPRSAKRESYKVASTPACIEKVLIFAGLGPMPLPAMVWR